ncbi:MAG: T9SS type A sorting domain-containing protein, partial [Candidatus Marinimicrobia bacterium]|nr:T9SS type A sorting domain-containing protein [Candidatus Neomarinimicrobiota bacterium]
PNPFNGSTTISYAIPDESHVRMILYDIRGREVRTLIDENQVPGFYQTHWNGLNDDQLGLSAGVYLCRIKAGNHSKIIKMVYLK